MIDNETDASSVVLVDLDVNGPSFAAGLRRGDQVTVFDDHPLSEPVPGENGEGGPLTPQERLRRLAEPVVAGDLVALTYLRDGVETVAIVRSGAWMSKEHSLFWYGSPWFALWFVIPLTTLGMLLTVMLLHSGYRLGNETERRQILWQLLSGVLGVLLFAANNLILWGFFFTESALFAVVGGLLGRWIDHILLVVLFSAWTFAIFARGAFDVRPLVSRTTVYGTLGIVAFMAFTVLESLISEFFEARLDLPDMVGASVSGASVAAIVLPLRRWLSGKVDRWMGSAQEIEVQDV